MLGSCDQLCPCVQRNFVMGFNIDKLPPVSMLMEAGCLSLTTKRSNSLTEAKKSSKSRTSNYPEEL